MHAPGCRWSVKRRERPGQCAAARAAGAVALAPYKHAACWSAGKVQGHVAALENGCGHASHRYLRRKEDNGRARSVTVSRRAAPDSLLSVRIVAALVQATDPAGACGPQVEACCGRCWWQQDGRCSPGDHAADAPHHGGQLQLQQRCWTPALHIDCTSRLTPRPEDTHQS